MKMINLKKISLYLFVTCFLACSAHAQDGPPRRTIDVSKIPEVQPQTETMSLLGNSPRYMVMGQEYLVTPVEPGHTEHGIASWYGTKFHKRSTSNGEPYNMYAMTAAHKTLPLPSYVRVTHLDSGKNVIVRVNDRGPFHDERIIDLSYAAAKKLDLLANGTGKVTIEVLAVPIDKTVLFVQAGAFQNRQRAQKQQHKLQQLTSHPVRILPQKLNKRMIYRVKIGPIHSPEHLAQLESQLQQVGINDTMTIRVTT